MELSEEQYPMRRIQKVHFVGIGGAGMSGIAEVLHNQGYEVTGSDLNNSEVTQRLSHLGIKIHQSHNPNNILGADVVVFSTAIKLDNPEVKAAQEALIPLVPRAEMLAELMRYRYGIAVAGSHGKTTVTSLIASLLGSAGFDPTFVIGGKLNSIGAHAQLGKSRYFLAEADESDASFLYLKPVISVITNIDQDHMQTYQNSQQKLLDTFVQFIHNLPFYGLAVVCIDDPNVKSLLPRLSRPTVTYGFAEEADVRIKHCNTQSLQSELSIQIPKKDLNLTLKVNLAGRYNVLNTVAAIAVALECGVPAAMLQTCLQDFSGVGRRFEVYKQCDIANKKVTLIDDYGHHPNELVEVMSAVRELWPRRRCVMVFQPHRYTRTRDLFNDFVRVLSQVDVLLLLNVYPASEALIPGAGSEALYHALKAASMRHCQWVGDLENLDQALQTVLQEDDVLLMQGAGDIGSLVANFVP